MNSYAFTYILESNKILLVLKYFSYNTKVYYKYREILFSNECKIKIIFFSLIESLITELHNSITKQ